MTPNPYLCTLTGADDTVDPGDLFQLSQEFPFVEWGILIGSKSRHRFPSANWIRRLCLLANYSDKKINLSLHICGSQLDLITTGNPIPGSAPQFKRCQLNFHGEPRGNVGGKIAEAFEKMLPWAPTIIFQLDGENHSLSKECLANAFSCVGLHDLSHGAGVTPAEWPEGGTAHMPYGYAGGLGPDNIAEQLPKIHAAAFGAPYWIDMETKLYTGLQFDLAKCREVLTVVQAFRQ